MTTTDTIAALALVAAIVAAVAAVGSWKAARNSDKAAETMSRIEQQRLHTDLTPDFRCTIVANEACSTAMLRVHLDGPPGLLSHDAVEITVSIRNDSPHRGSGPQLAGSVTPEAVRAHIWGPWKFSADGRDDTGRTVAAQQLAVGEWTRYGLTPTSPPLWSASTTDAWRRDYANEPVRLSITAMSQGSEWIVPLEVPVTIESAS
ncbi:hypothetical protein [Streptomyces turgidiscabies]|uniref:Secreted protein n=1 Tax=Streptomyces turgidiscabies TaxID=85558 RepID=A0ABU0RSW9_9ACTN|nr:hypothetical protein [Streptomyces turgidiscabies]MDQ0935095.1 hypothetical protein [Streptomyces turgidiscabies]